MSVATELLAASVQLFGAVPQGLAVFIQLLTGANEVIISFYSVISNSYSSYWQFFICYWQLLMSYRQLLLSYLELLLNYDSCYSVIGSC